MRVSQDELNKVKEAMNAEKKARVYKRYQSLYLYMSGKTCNEVAEIVGLNKASVSRVNQLYKKEGLAGIPDKPIAGRPSRLTKEQLTDIKDLILNKRPVDVGFPAEFNWTSELIAKYIKKEYGFDYSVRGVTGMLKRLGLSYTRPTYVLAKADKQKQEQFKEDFKKVKKTCWTTKSNTFSSPTNR